MILSPFADQPCSVEQSGEAVRFLMSRRTAVVSCSSVSGK